MAAGRSVVAPEAAHLRRGSPPRWRPLPPRWSARSGRRRRSPRGGRRSCNRRLSVASSIR